MENKRNLKVGAISLGCDKNRVDTENMLFYVKQAGYSLTSDVKEADVIVINTCAFIESAQKESIDTILEMAELKKQRPVKIIVTGCMPQRFKEEFAKNLPEVDGFLGFKNYQQIAEVIQKVVSGERVGPLLTCTDVPTTNRILTTDYHTAYLKIAEGCDNHCTYCAMPQIRGKYQSRTLMSLVDEAKMLIDNYGVKEINLVAQDTTRYGIDIYGKYALPTLLEQLQKLDVEWIRILYCYPELLSDDIIKIVAEDNKVCRYLDIPLQHVDDKILKRMGRRTTEAPINSLLERIILANEDIAIRSTFITGFPTETEEQHLKLYNFIADARLNYAGFFAYSKEEGTPAAKMRGQIIKSIKRQRQKELQELQSAIVQENQRNLEGSEQKVLYEGIDYDKQMFVGRTEFNAPDVDTKVYFKSQTPVEAGNFYKVKIKMVRKLDLVGVVVNDNGD